MTGACRQGQNPNFLVQKFTDKIYEFEYPLNRLLFDFSVDSDYYAFTLVRNYRDIFSTSPLNMVISFSTGGFGTKSGILMPFNLESPVSVVFSQSNATMLIPKLASSSESNPVVFFFLSINGGEWSLDYVAVSI